MGKNHKVLLGKKDDLIRSWWDMTAAAGQNISKTIICAMDYYRITGDFLTIAYLKEPQNSYESVIRYVYLQEKTDLYEWIQQDGKKLGTFVKYVLRGSLVVGNESKLIPLDTLMRQLDQAKAVIKRGKESQPLLRQDESYQAVEPKKTPAVKAADESKVSETKPVAKQQPEAEDPPEMDLFSMLVGNKGLNI